MLLASAARGALQFGLPALARLTLRLHNLESAAAEIFGLVDIVFLLDLGRGRVRRSFRADLFFCHETPEVTPSLSRVRNHHQCLSVLQSTFKRCLQALGIECGEAFIENYQIGLLQ
jgi:hypothetical protein